MKLNKIADLYAANQIYRDELMQALENIGYVTATSSEVGVVVMEQLTAEEDKEIVED